jgi:hypothetical protein
MACFPWLIGFNLFNPFKLFSRALRNLFCRMVASPPPQIFIFPSIPGNGGGKATRAVDDGAKTDGIRQILQFRGSQRMILVVAIYYRRDPRRVRRKRWSPGRFPIA